MRLRRGFRLPMSGVALLLLIGALPMSVAAADPAPRPDPLHVITRLGDQPPAGTPAVAKASAVQSFRFSARGRLTVPGESGDLTLTMSGEFALPDRLHAALTLKLQDKTTSDTVGPLELTLIGSTPYVHLPADLSPTKRDVWVLIDNPDGGGALPTAMVPNLGNLPPVSTQTQTLADETIGGTLTTHTRVIVDATALFSGGAKNAKPSNLTVDVWTGKADNFPRRVGINGDLTIDPDALASLIGGGTSTGSAKPVTMTLSFTIDFTDLNAPVTINAPTTFVKLSDFVK